MAKALRQLNHKVTLLDTATGKEISTDNVPGQVGMSPPSLEELTQWPAERNFELLCEIIRSKAVREADEVVIGLHGGIGENGTIQALLDLAKIPYSGSGVLASALAMNKLMSKRIFETQDVPTPEYLFFKKNMDQALAQSRVESKFHPPIVVKPNEEGSTVGLTIVKNWKEFQKAFDLAADYGDVLVESYIAGRELTVTVVGDEAFPVIEIIPEGGFYDYEHKYTKGKTNYVCPAEIPASVSDDARRLAKKAFDALGCEGYARVDFRLSTDQQLFCLEVNTLPGMTATSLVPKAAKAAGLEFEDLVEKIVQLSLQKQL